MNYLNDTQHLFEKMYKNGDHDRRVKLLRLLFDSEDFEIDEDRVYSHMDIILKSCYPYGTYGVIQKFTIEIHALKLPKITLNVLLRNGTNTTVKGSFLTILKTIYGNNDEALLNLQKTLFGVL